MPLSSESECFVLSRGYPPPKVQILLSSSSPLQKNLPEQLDSGPVSYQTGGFLLLNGRFFPTKGAEFSYQTGGGD